MDGWGIANTGAATGAYNMRTDELLARQLAAGTGAPTLRLFRWKPWAISLGYNQSAADIDAARCAADGIDIVRRPTGGRAILHAEELTYSIVMDAGRKGVLQVYNDISHALLRGLALIGVPATLQKSQPDFPGRYREVSSIPCFTSSARYEIEWQGRKLVGSAQRRFTGGERDVVLQHGSILCGPAHRRLADYLMAEQSAINDIRREMLEKTVDCSEIIGGPVDLDALSSAIRKGFELEWGVSFREHHLLSVPDEAIHA